VNTYTHTSQSADIAAANLAHQTQTLNNWSTKQLTAIQWSHLTSLLKSNKLRNSLVYLDCLSSAFISNMKEAYQTM